MTRRKLFALLSAAALVLTGCTPLPEAAFPSVPAAQSTTDAAASPVPATASPAPDISFPEVPTASETGSVQPQLEISAGGYPFTAVLEDNAAAEAFLSLLPAAFDMTELNGNEKYCWLSDFRFPTDPAVPEVIRAGDLCIYQDNCLVLFYETHRTSYAYTPLGHIVDPEELLSAVGTGNVTVEMSVRTQ